MNRTLFNSQLTDIDSSAKDIVGSLRQQDGIWYKYVQIKNTTATVAGVAGDPVAFFAITGAAAHRVVLDCSDADSQPICAGFLMGTVTGTLTVAYYGWIQITGSVIVPTAVVSGVVGTGCMMVAGGATDKTLTVVTGVIESCACETSATAANNTVLARCPF